MHSGITAALQRIRTKYPRLSRFIAGRFARGEYLGLHLTIGLAISGLALLLFGHLTEDVLTHDPITRFDTVLLEWLHHHASPTGTKLFIAVSRLASPEAMAVLAIAGLVLLIVQRRWFALIGWIAAFAGGSLLDYLLKVLIQRPRPPYASALLHNPTWSFPSGHAMGALIGYGMLAYVLVLITRGRRTHALIIAGAATVIVSIGVSRLYLGVHYFSDVIGGYAAGALWLSACISAVEVARRWRMTQSNAASS